VRRRRFLEAAAGAVVCGQAQTAGMRVIDTHVHLFDPTRKQGVPWPTRDNTVLYKPALPARYRAIAGPFGVRGIIVVEASSWLEDNQWVLDLAAHEPLILGTVGNLEPDKPEFGRQLERFHRNPRFRGIRYGNLWLRSLGRELAKRPFIDGLKLLASSGLSLDTANPDRDLMAAVVRLTDRVPELRVVVDHLPQMDPAEAHLKELSARPQVYVKISQVLRRVGNRVPEDLAFYRDRLDAVFGAFGEDRVLFGSDWPNSDNWAPYATVFKLVHEYFAQKSESVREKYFWKNAVRAYRIKEPRG
jgi:L-fuconolactonase